MKAVVDWIQSLAVALGAPGLFVVAFLDSSFLSLPQINDLLLVLSVTRSPELMPVYASMATLGSIGGCMVMYYIGRKGGDALLRRRLAGRRFERAMALFTRHGVLAVLVASILPPPAPFKLFVLVAGASRMPPFRFVAAIAVGRGFRYFGEGLLAVWYGQRALAFIDIHGKAVSLWLGVAVLACGVGYVVWQRRRARTGRAPEERAL